MNKEELLKEIMKLPKVETDTPISAYGSVNVDDLISAVDRLNKVPTYNELLRENQKQNKKMSKLKEYCNDDKNFEILDLYSQDKVDEIQQDLLSIIGDDK